MKYKGLIGSELYSERTFPTEHDVLKYKLIKRKVKIQLYQGAQTLLRTMRPKTSYLIEEYGLIPLNRKQAFEDMMTNLKQRRGILEFKDLLSKSSLEAISRDRVISISVPYQDEKEFFLLLSYSKEDNYLLFLDLLELLSSWISFHYEKESSKQMDDMINSILNNNGIGYELIENKIIHKGNVIIHKEVVRPSLHFLSDPHYAGANEEMLKAYSDFKDKDYKNAIHNASKAFESTMKIIVEKNNWELKNIGNRKPIPKLENATASVLIATIIEHSDIEKFHVRALKGLNDVLQSLSTLRNNHTGHGQGGETKESDVYHCEFALHTAASNILYLVKRYS